MALLTLSRNDKRLVDLPTSWSNKNRHEQLQREAAESFSNLVALAVAKSNTNFQLYDALRPIEEQKEIFFDRYRRTNWGSKRNRSDRSYDGSIWRKVKGANAAAPGFSNHGSGLAVDIHPGPIQEIFKSDGPAWGWSWDEGRDNGENWHFVFVGGNRYASRGWLDHAWVQKVVGADVDGKIGTGTVEKIKAYQKAHGLEADGIVGPGTKKVMQGKGEAPAAPKEPDAVVIPSEDGGFTYTYLREEWDTQGISEGVHPYDAPVKGIYLHWPASTGKLIGASAESIAKTLRGYRRDHIVGNGWKDIAYGAAVDWAGRTYQLRGLDMEVGSNGGSASNSEAGSILYLLGIGEKPTPAMIDAGNALLAQYGKKYGEGYLRGHRESPDASTTCPGDELMALRDAGEINWDGKAGAVVSGGTLVKDSGKGHVVEDGRLGGDTVSEMQTRLGVTPDGRAAEKTWKALQIEVDAPYKDGQISRQSYRAEELGNGVVDRKSAWEFTGRRSSGSQTVEKLQSLAGAKPDGTWFEGTTLALQKAMNRDKNFLRR